MRALAPTERWRKRGLALAVLAASLPGFALALGAAHPAPPPAAPPPAVTVTLTAAAPDHGWELRLTNAGSVPLRIVADPRLYAFEVTPPAGGAPAPAPAPAPPRGRRATAPAAHGPVRCTLPAEMVPTTDTERTLTLVAGRSWTISVDPRLWCFSAAQGAALVDGATVTATFGWSPNRSAPPYAVAPIAAGVDAGVGPARNVSAAPVTLTAASLFDGGALSDATDAAVSAPPSDAYPVHLKVSLPERLDISRVFEQTLTVAIVNEGDRPVRSLFAPATIGFTVQTPRGIVMHCGATRAVTILPELAGSIPPRGRTAVSLDLAAACPDVFRKPGLYRVRPRFDARHAAGTGTSSYYAGEATGDPMFLRVRTGEDPLPPPRVDPP